MGGWGIGEQWIFKKQKFDLALIKSSQRAKIRNFIFSLKLPVQKFRQCYFFTNRVLKRILFKVELIIHIISLSRKHN
jgi:hypothetical protein